MLLRRVISGSTLESTDNTTQVNKREASSLNYISGVHRQAYLIHHMEKL